MNSNDEIQKIQSKLKLPISAINIKPTYVEIFSGKESIGGIPYIKTLGDINVYDTDERNLFILDWSKVYEKHKQDLGVLISKNLLRTDIELTPATFRRVYVKDLSKEIIGYFECAYENGKWTVSSLKFH